MTTPEFRRRSKTSLLLLAATFVIVMLSACGSENDQAQEPSPFPAPSTSRPIKPSRAPATEIQPSASITIAGIDVDGKHITVAGFVSGVSESGGDCQYLISSMDGKNPIRVVVVGQANVKTTSCGSVQIPSEQFHRGTWKAVLDYRSPRSNTTSPPIRFEIP